MRVGYRARIFLGTVAAAAIAALIASGTNSVIPALLAAALGAFVVASVAEALASARIRRVETVAAETTQRLVQQVNDLTVDRSRAEAILAGMVEGVLVVDAGGRLRLINDAARRMLHLEDIALVRHYVEAVRHPAIVQQLGAALRAERPQPTEVAVGNRIFSAQATPAKAVSVAAETGGGAVLVLHDISELRHADRVRRDFVANVSHELRTPLTAVRGYVEALMEEPLEPDQRKQFLSVIDRHTIRMERLVRDLLRLARLDAQQEAVERHPCEIESLFRAVTSDLSGPIERQKVQIDVTVASDAAVVTLDPIKFHDVLRNLIENAVNYSPEGGHVSLDARVDGETVAISVADEGPGLPDSDLERVFERFYRVDKSRTRDPGGTGLGLSIVRHLIELHGGRVQARNKAGGGAVFTVMVPR